VVIPVINFINVLQAAFMRANPKSAEKTDNLTVFFALSGSAQVKAARKMSTKLTPDGSQPSYPCSLSAGSNLCPSNIKTG